MTLILLDERVDHGPILAQREFTMTSDYNYDKLCRALASLGAETLIDVLPKFIKGEIRPTPQNHAEATYTKKFTVDDAFVDFEDLKNAIEGQSLEKAREIERKIMALNPEPGVWTITKEALFGLPKEKRVKLLESVVEDERLILKKVQVEGKTPLRINSKS